MEAATEEAVAVTTARSEADIVADAIWALVVAEILPKKAADLKKAVMAAGITVAELRDADYRRSRNLYRPPSRHRHADWSEEAVERWREGSHRGRINGSRRRSRQPSPGQTTMHCPLCGNDLSIDDNFPFRADRPKQRWTTCNGCRRERSRDRYLNVERERALNMARLTFVIVEDDERIGLGCVDCGEVFVAGDHVEGVAQLHHVNCPKESRA